MSHVAEEGGSAGSRDCLGHLKVLELCNLVAGSYCAKLMAPTACPRSREPNAGTAVV